jgi:short-subunit dehydrogenase
MDETRGAIVVGASSGIGEALARKLAAEGYEVGLTARRIDRLRRLAEELPTKSYVARMDVTDAETARGRFETLADAMTSVDLIVISAGVAHLNDDLEWDRECETIDVNVRGFAAVATAAITYFEAHETAGHLVGISSIAAHFGNGGTQAYNASKAFVSTYLEGLRTRAAGNDADVTITTIEPGFVDTEMAYGSFWMCSPETAAAQIVQAIREKRDCAYVTRRWRLVAWAFDVVPDRVLRRILS